MKRIFEIILAAAAALPMAVSCSEKSETDVFPEEYHTIMYIKENVTRSLTLDATSGDVTLSFTVCKGGSDITKEATAVVSPVSQNTIDLEYNTGEGDNYLILPSGTYTLDTDPELDFAATEDAKRVYYTLKSEKIAELVGNNPDARYLMAFELTSSDTNVNGKCSRYVCEIADVIVPAVGFERAGINRLEIQLDGTYDGNRLTIELPVEVKSIENRWDITAEADVDMDYLAEYNAVNYTDYAVPDKYTVTKSISLGKDEQKAYITVVIENVTGLDRIMMLPISISEVSQFKVSEGDRTCVLLIVPTIARPEEISRDGWLWKECCSQAGEGNLANVLDGNAATYWHYSWEPSSPCKGHPNHCLVFDTGRSRFFSHFGYQRRQDAWEGVSITALDFYVSDNDAVWNQSVYDDSNWTRVVSGQTVSDSSNELQNIPAVLSKGRYIRVKIVGTNPQAGIEGNNGVMKGAIAEICAYGKDL